MLAYAMHLCKAYSATEISLHPDGEHGKRFDFRASLSRRGFDLVEARGTTKYGGIYRSDDGTEIMLIPKSGMGDVVAFIGSQRIVAEAKGGILNTSHPGPVSRVRRGLCEAVGLLLSKTREKGTRQVAVVPDVDVTRRLAALMIPRLRPVGIEIALVNREGTVDELR